MNNRFDLTEHSHRRYNPLTGEWVQVSPHRSKRPWQGQVEKTEEDRRPAFDATCYLCPGNVRANGEVNPTYTATYSFTNDFAALVSDVPQGEFQDGDLLLARSEAGICRVICFSPRHDLTIAEMDTDGIRRVVDLWVDEYTQLSRQENIRYVQIFENKGTVMGCSNPHPHGQIWAQESIPVEPGKKQQHQEAYYQRKGTTLLSDYWQLEVKRAERIIFENEHFVALVPFWAVWPFETMIIPKRAMARITDMTEAERQAFADAYRRLATRYDNLFEVSFPYSAGIHQAPSDGTPHAAWHWHMVFYPPLLRSATVKKFMVGYEMLANPQRDITPEFSAARLRDLPETHYKQTLLSESSNP
ncbi:UDP-glucose--hexose-1-phosphate uridylyltransferase [Parachryseolinea silvisoli]|uniref:UDP-glucose--hexose-1-phosphate uridylyltransferase n=1 Tax=Parachryseolinea silvisoli TaxID=2873601 RepID=UPI002265CF8B|nr:UDP-glucose--hexose-1-phosphate uridylyltransferase [Parachryseolinea silvisoli]MCD9019830.1 UDP-glucose--hexose-1-phosphate uridylyltransferase [Parachryseolinea silvisoli]